MSAFDPTSGLNMARNIERWAARLAHSVERRIDDARGRARSASARQVVAYRGYGTAQRLFVTGRVLANPPAGPITAEDRWWRNLAHALSHMESNEVAGARLRLRLGHTEHEAITDEEGFYRAALRPGEPLGGALWHDVHVEVVDRVHPGIARVHDVARVIVPGPQARFGVISDLDDTVIRTEATRLLRMLRRTLLENSRTRLPFEGVAQFYSALHHGAGGDVGNPIFYVSSSPWNLYGVLTDFLAHQAIPDGPLILRDWGLTERALLPRGHGEHKLGAIRAIMDCYPAMPFILIGDSGQEDPEIYRDVVHTFGGRILAVYIRNVTGMDALRVRKIGELAEEVRGAGSELLLSDDTLASARHAAERGWVTDDTVEEIARAISSSGGRPG